MLDQSHAKATSAALVVSVINQFKMTLAENTDPFIVYKGSAPE